MACGKASSSLGMHGKGLLLLQRVAAQVVCMDDEWNARQRMVRMAEIRMGGGVCCGKALKVYL